METSIITARFEVKKWEEHNTVTFENQGKINRSSVVYSYSGDMQGEGVVDYVMFYNPDKTGYFVGLEYFSGSIHGKKGTCIIQHRGTFTKEGQEAEDYTTNVHWEIAAQSGKGELHHVKGHGNGQLIGHGPTFGMSLYCSFV